MSENVADRPRRKQARSSDVFIGQALYRREEPPMSLGHPGDVVLGSEHQSNGTSAGWLVWHEAVTIAQARD